MAMTIPTTGSNTTGSRGVVAVDKVGNKIRFFDPATLSEVKVIDGPEPCVHELAISHDHQHAFVPLYGDGIYGGNKSPNNKIVVLDLERQEVAGLITLGSEHKAPHGMVTTADRKLWVVCDLPRKLLLVDPARRAVEADYDVPVKGPHIVCATVDGKRLYISAKEGDITVFDTERRSFIASIPVRVPGVDSGNGSGTEGITPTPDGNRIVAIDNDRGDLRVIDMATHREIDRVPMTQQALSNIKRSRLGKLMFSPDGKHLVVTAYTSGNCWLIDAADYRRQTLVPLAKGPMGMAFPPEGGSVIVTSHDSGLLTRIDLVSRRAVTAYDGGAGIEVLTYY
jgi:DNA-binding beta-propeller fold protein YncE